MVFRERPTPTPPTGPTARTRLFLTRPIASIANFSIFDIAGAFEDTSFASLADLVSDNTLKAVQEMGFEHMTEIQHKSIRPLLEGRSVDVALFEGT